MERLDAQELRVGGETLVLRAGEDDFVVRFDEGDSTRARLIRFVYSGRFAADVPRIEPIRIATAALGRVMR